MPENEKKGRIEKITKSYDCTLSLNFQTWKFGTIITKTVEVNSAEELTKESDKLFQEVKILTNRDVENTKAEIQEDLQRRDKGEI